MNELDFGPNAPRALDPARGRCHTLPDLSGESIRRSFRFRAIELAGMG